MRPPIPGVPKSGWAIFCSRAAATCTVTATASKLDHRPAQSPPKAKRTKTAAVTERTSDEEEDMLLVCTTSHRPKSICVPVLVYHLDMQCRCMSTPTFIPMIICMSTCVWCKDRSSCQCPSTRLDVQCLSNRAFGHLFHCTSFMRRAVTWRGTPLFKDCGVPQLGLHLGHPRPHIPHAPGAPIGVGLSVGHPA